MQTVAVDVHEETVRIGGLLEVTTYTGLRPLALDLKSNRDVLACCDSVAKVRMEVILRE